MTSASQVQRKRLFPGEHDLAREVPDIAFEASQVQPSFVLPVLECLDRSPPLIESIQHRRASALPAVKRESFKSSWQTQVKKNENNQMQFKCKTMHFKCMG